MDRLCVIADNDGRLRELRSALSAYFEAQYFPLSGLPESAPCELTLVDIDLHAYGACHQLRNWLRRRARGGQAIFCVRRDSHADAVQAFALGATGLIVRPVTGAGLRAQLRSNGSKFAELGDGFISEAPGIAAGATALHEIFESAIQGGPVDSQVVNKAGEAIVGSIEEDGLPRWIEAVRRHHSQTYQHCLLVTGIAVGFARDLGFNSQDKRRLGIAGLLHDVGKAKIPLEILEKAGPLDATEAAVMRGHAELGMQILESAPGIQPEMLDVVVHHHEYLDGSGYPHGLMGNSISDLVRTVTIADVYGALIERRSYRPPMPPAQAYDILTQMGGKLDRDLVRAFRAIAHA